jgi:hypothetical protein
MMRRAFARAMVPLLLGAVCMAQQASSQLLLKVDRTSSGPFMGEEGASCMKFYSDGKLTYSSWRDWGGQGGSRKAARQEKRDSREYKFSKEDSWEVEDFADFLKSRSVQLLKPYFKPSHQATDYFETSTLQIFLPDGKTKKIETREYYVAFLEEKAKYPSALIILMDRIEQLERRVAEKGISAEVPSDCKLEH